MDGLDHMRQLALHIDADRIEGVVFEGGPVVEGIHDDLAAGRVAEKKLSGGSHFAIHLEEHTVACGAGNGRFDDSVSLFGVEVHEVSVLFIELTTGFSYRIRVAVSDMPRAIELRKININPAGILAVAGELAKIRILKGERTGDILKGLVHGGSRQFDTRKSHGARIGRIGIAGGKKQKQDACQTGKAQGHILTF